MNQPSKPIQQQYFTRDREGVFRTSEGFDTVAKSAGLDNGFIKTTLHPYCVYKAPKELLGKAEEDTSRYPESLVVFHAENGDMVVGRSIFVGADFTGQRSTSFTHQFVIPKERKEEFLRDPQRLFAISGFQSAYDIRSGKVLPELADIDYNRSRLDANIQDQLLSRLGIDQTRFQQLIYAVMSSVTNKKKVYIALDTDIRESAETAKRLLELVYRCLPYAIRCQLGFNTFNSEPEGKQGLNVIFVEKGSIRLPDRQIEKEHIFDFPSGRFVNTELPARENQFLEFVWSRRKEPEGQLEPLFEFCEEALQGMGSAALNAQTYDQLCLLYELEQGREALYDNNRTGVMQAITSYVNAETFGQKRRLNDLFIRLLRKDAMDAGSLPDAEYIKYLLQYIALADEGVKTLLNQCFVLFISRVANRSEEGMDGAARIFDQLLAQESTFDSVMKELYAQQAATAESYVAYRMAKAGTVKALLEEIRFWVQHGAAMVQQRFFANEVLKKVKQLLQTDNSQKQIEAANALYRFFDELPEREGKQQYEDFCGQLKLEIQLELLDGLKSGNLEFEDIIQLGFMLESTDRELLSQLDSRQKQSLHLLGTIYKVLSLSKKEDSELVKAIDRLDTLDLDRVQQALKRLLAVRITSDNFSKIVYAFYQPNLSGGSGYAAEFDYYGMLQYIGAGSKDKGIIYDFLVWTADDKRFLNPRLGMDANYKAAVSKYFDMNAPRAFRDKEIRQKLLAVANPSFEALFKAIKLRQSGKWVRFFIKNRRRLVRIGLVVLPLIILLLIFRNPLLDAVAYVGPAPLIVVDPVPTASTVPSVTFKASAENADPTVQLFMNGQLVGSGKSSTTVELRPGDNSFEFKAVNRGGKASDVIRRDVNFAVPSPIVTIEALPETTRNNTVAVKVGALDSNDPSPTLYINGQAVGQTSITKTIPLTPGENTIEIKAGNKLGKMSEPIFKKIKYEPAASR
jgi:hypothetical protein